MFSKIKLQDLRNIYLGKDKLDILCLKLFKFSSYSHVKVLFTSQYEECLRSFVLKNGSDNCTTVNNWNGKMQDFLLI